MLKFLAIFESNIKKIYKILRFGKFLLPFKTLFKFHNLLSPDFYVTLHSDQKQAFWADFRQW